MSTNIARRHWPLLAIAAPAAVAIWSGWVGLGQLAGFGTIRPLPGILPWHLDTAITLPVGVEAYGAYALGAWLAPAGIPEGARMFARRSAIGALALGMLGQVVFHLLAAAHAARAPWPVTVLVSCVPVVTLGFAAALTHLLRAMPESAPEMQPHSVRSPAAEMHPQAASAPLPGVLTESAAPALEGAPVPVPGINGHAHPERTRSETRKRTRSAPDPLAEFAPELASGALPSLRQIRSRMHVGQDKARDIHRDLERARAALVGAGAAEHGGTVEDRRDAA